MSTLGALIEQVRHQLSGLDSTTDAVAALTEPLSSTDLIVHVDDTASGASRGIAEVDLEILRVKSVDQQDAQLTLYKFGRGYRGTPAVAHPLGVEIRFNPTWPASTIAREINGVLTELYPTIYGVQKIDTVFPPDAGEIVIPAGAIGVISIWVADGNTTGWQREDRWDYNRDGSGLHVGGARAGERVRVVYASQPAVFDLVGAMTQEYTTVTGLEARTADLLALGVAARLAIFMDVGKLPFVVAAAADANTERQPGTGGNAAKTLHALFQARLAAEAAVLTREHPIRVHQTR